MISTGINAINARVSQVLGRGSCLANSVRSKLPISERNLLSEGCGIHLGGPDEPDEGGEGGEGVEGDAGVGGVEGVEGGGGAEGSMIVTSPLRRFLQACLKMPLPIFFSAS